MAVSDEIARLKDQIKGLESVGKLEEQFIAAKAAGDDDQVGKIKYKLREARQAYRESRATEDLPDGAVAPAPVSASAQATSSGSEE